MTFLKTAFSPSDPPQVTARPQHRWLAGCFVALFSIAAHAQSADQMGINALETFVKSTRSGRAGFTQVVTSPAKEGQPAKSKTSSGSFEFLRPNRFSFVYKKPFE
ncbi:MAG: hypothetical protein LH479_12755, partial [Polaromonas sp.]|nr:hypothetical protein [Polaromonas sp.]